MLVVITDDLNAGLEMYNIVVVVLSAITSYTYTVTDSQRSGKCSKS